MTNSQSKPATTKAADHVLHHIKSFPPAITFSRSKKAKEAKAAEKRAAEQLVRELDPNGDGTVTKMEFRKQVRSLLEPPKGEKGSSSSSKVDTSAVDALFDNEPLRKTLVKHSRKYARFGLRTTGRRLAASNGWRMVWNGPRRGLQSRTLALESSTDS